MEIGICTSDTSTDFYSGTTQQHRHRSIPPLLLATTWQCNYIKNLLCLLSFFYFCSSSQTLQTMLPWRLLLPVLTDLNAKDFKNRTILPAPQFTLSINALECIFQKTNELYIPCISVILIYKTECTHELQLGYCNQLVAGSGGISFKYVVTAQIEKVVKKLSRKQVASLQWISPLEFMASGSMFHCWSLELCWDSNHTS